MIYPSPATYVLVDVHVKERNVTVSSAVDIHDIPNSWRLPRIFLEIHLGLPATPANPGKSLENSPSDPLN